MPRFSPVFRAVVMVSMVLCFAVASHADVGLTYLGAFSTGVPGHYGGGLAYYPAGNGGAGSLFIGRSSTGSAKEVYEFSIPPLVISSDVTALNVATTLNSFDTNTATRSLVWRSTDDRLYYSNSVDGSGQVNFRSINRDGTGESAVSLDGTRAGYALTQIPDDWAAAHAGGKNLLTLANLYGVRLAAVDPWNATVTQTVVLQYTSQNRMNVAYPGGYYGVAWVEVGDERTIVVATNDTSGTPRPLILFFHVSDIENAAQLYEPQPYYAMEIRDRLVLGGTSLTGLAYDAANQILYGVEGTYSNGVLVHGWRANDVGEMSNPPTAIVDLAALDPQLHAVRLSWSAPSDDRDPGHRAARYEVRYSTSPITEANFADATIFPQTLTPAAPGQPETLLVTGLEMGTTYYFAIKSADLNEHVSALSNVASATTLVPDTTAPAAVTDLAIASLDTRQLTLSWTAPGDDDMAGTAASYDIRYSTSELNAANFEAAASVSQNLVPQPAGQAESLVVPGLTPGTTYWLAMKARDEVGNTSGLSNVVQVTTLVDVTPPAAIADLTATPDAFSADLSWTAPGDDEATGTATRYEIRCSTSAIDEANWAAAAVVPNPLVPQPAGSVEQFTVFGLQPGTTYYFAVKAIDEEGNVAALSNVASVTTSPWPLLPLVTSVTVVEKAGVTTANYPLTLSMLFQRGDVPDNVLARVAGSVLATQTDVKMRWPDGSVKHALVTFVLPSLQAGSEVVVDFLAGGPNANRQPITKTQLLARDFDARLTVTLDGTPTTISARQMLTNAATVETWLQGDVCTEFLIKDFDTNIANQLNVQYRVRAYSGCDAIRVETVVENCWAEYRGNLTYDFSLVLGQASPQEVLAQAGLLHNNRARWHKIFWQGETPPAVQVKFSLPYLIGTRMIPRYDTSIVVSESSMATCYSRWLSRPHDLMGYGLFTRYMPTTGQTSSEHIGIHPSWAVRYLLSMDERMREVTINSGDISGYVPIHFRESDRTRSFFGRVLSIDDRPTIRIEEWNASETLTQDKLPAPIGDMTTDWTPDAAHQPSFACMPYLLTGEYYYLEEMYFWSSWNLASGNPGYRNGAAGCFYGQTRSMAWQVRTLAQTAAFAPDGSPEKAYFTAKLNNNLANWVGKYVGSSNYGCFRHWNTAYLEGPTSGLEPTCAAVTSTWQDDFMTTVLGHIKELGYDSQTLLDWFGQTLVERFSFMPGWNPYRGTGYTTPVRYYYGTGTLPYATWADVNNAWIDKVGPSDFPLSEDVGSYNYISRGAMTYVTHLPGGRAAWEWLNSHLHSNADLADDPKLAYLPPTVGDINDDGVVDVVDLLYLVDSWGKAAGEPGFDPRCDFNNDGNVDVEDLLTLVENWPQ